MKFRLLIPSLLICCISISSGTENPGFQVTFPAIILSDVQTEIKITSSVPSGDSTFIQVRYQNEIIPVMLSDGKGEVWVHAEPNKHIAVTVEGRNFTAGSKTIPLWYSVIPPFIAILFALLFREVFSALLLGLLSGTFMIAWYGGAGFFASLGLGLLRIIDTYIIDTLSNKDHVSIIVFSFMIGGMVHIITKNGGMKGVVRHISRYAVSRRSTLLSTWLLGLVVFFDDYANTLVVGNTMRPLSDRMKISREKLSYVVDSTAAPVASIAFITTWIGAELSYIKNAVDVINTSSAYNITESPYGIFFQSLAYSFYPILTLIFVGLLIISKRDYGPMRRAEMAARCARNAIAETPLPVAEDNAEQSPEPTIRPRGYNALIPVLTVIAGTCIGLVVTGMEQTGWDSHAGFGNNLSNVIGHADSFRALLWASFSGMLVAIILTLTQKLLSLQRVVDSMIDGFKTMLSAMMILVLAWSLAQLTKNLSTAEYLAALMLQLEITPVWIPGITFILAGLIAFSTGSSWGTMAILYPLLLPTAWTLFHDHNLPVQDSMMLFHIIVASVLAGAVFGDHCSPISDTTILSSLATECNHMEHVRTQLPYAITTGLVSIFLGIIPVSLGLNPLLAFGVSLTVLWLLIRFLGKK